MNSICDSLCSGEVYLIPSVFGPVSAAGSVPFTNGSVPAINTGVKKEFTTPLLALQGQQLNSALVSAPAFASSANANMPGSTNAIVWQDEFSARGGNWLTSVKTDIAGMVGWTPYDSDLYLFRQSPSYCVMGRLNLIKISATPSFIPHFLVGVSLISAVDWANGANFSGSGRTVANYIGPWTHYMTGIDTSTFVSDSAKEASFMQYQNFNPNSTTVNPNGTGQSIAEFNASGAQCFGWFMLGCQAQRYLPSQYDGSVSVLSLTYLQG